MSELQQSVSRKFIIDRLQELQRTPKLLTALVERSKDGFTDATKETDQLIASKRQERLKASRQLGNLSNVLAEAPEGIQVKTLLTKISDIEGLCEQLDQAIADLEQQRAGSPSQVIKEDHVLKIFRAFNKGFGKLPVQEQRELIRRAVSRITVSNEGIVHVQYYGSVKPDTLLGNSAARFEATLLNSSDLSQYGNGLTEICRAAASASQRSMVCSVSEVVEYSGVEPLTSCMPCKRSTN